MYPNHHLQLAKDHQKFHHAVSPYHANIYIYIYIKSDEDAKYHLCDELPQPTLLKDHPLGFCKSIGPLGAHF